MTINKFTELDSFPLPKIDNIVNKVVNFKFISKLDLKSAYSQWPLHQHYCPYTEFQLGDELFEWRDCFFGVTNDTTCFQRLSNDFVKRHNLQDHVFPYLDDWPIGGNTKEEHSKDLELMLQAAEEEGLILNKTKCNISKREIPLLGHIVGNGIFKPDPERVQALLGIHLPSTKKNYSVLSKFTHIMRNDYAISLTASGL